MRRRRWSLHTSAEEDSVDDRSQAGQAASFTAPGAFASAAHAVEIAGSPVSGLPIEAVLPELTAALRHGSNAVLVAPPGAGKTTRIPLALLDEPWRGEGRIILLEPRRIAARAAAVRMAQNFGEAVGGLVGFRVRGESQVSSRTRIEVVTEGVFTRMILQDPALEGVSAVIFDEFHERSLEADVGLALALNAQGVLRPDLRILVMSATLQAEPVGELLGSAPVIRSEGRAFPVEIRHLGGRAGGLLEEQVAGAVRRALREESGGVLVFLPGQGEILGLQRRLDGALPAGVRLAPLFGALGPEQQDLAIAPAAPGERKVVLATAIAQTSLTLEGVRVVIDAGLSRQPRYDPASGLTRLQTVRVSRAAAEQRAGRAGRTQSGVCYRLWDAEETRALAPYDPPEMLHADLSGVALTLCAWGDPLARDLAFLDPPPPGPLAEAIELLLTLGATQPDGGLTAHGQALTRLPLPPRLGHMILAAAAAGSGQKAALLAALLVERNLGGRSVDVAERLEMFRREANHRARQARALAQRWAASAGASAQDRQPLSEGELLLEAFPERAAERLGPGDFRLAQGRRATVDLSSPLSLEPFIVAAELGGRSGRDRIHLAAALSAEQLKARARGRIERVRLVEACADGRVRARTVERLGAIVFHDHEEAASAQETADALMRRVAALGLPTALQEGAVAALGRRTAFLREVFGDDWPDLSPDQLAAQAETWLRPLLAGVRSLDDVRAEDAAGAVRALLPPALVGAFERLAPSRFLAPTGSALAIDYAADAGPLVTVRVQEMFGLDVHPSVADGRRRLTLALTSPAGRPLQVTRDLPAFWRGSWADVRREMRGRYPKHPWPAEPQTAAPTTRAKPRGT